MTASAEAAAEQEGWVTASAEATGDRESCSEVRRAPPPDGPGRSRAVFSASPFTYKIMLASGADQP